MADTLFAVNSLISGGAVFLISFFIPEVKGYNEKKNQKKFIELFKDKKLIFIYFYVFILSSTNAFFQSFQAIYCKEIGIDFIFGPGTSTSEIVGVVKTMVGEK